MKKKINAGVCAGVFAIAMIAGVDAVSAAGKPGRTNDCGLIDALPNAVNPVCEIPYNGGYIYTDFDTVVRALCDATEAAEFKNESDMITLMSKSIDMAIKVEQGKEDPDAATKIAQYEAKLDDLNPGEINDPKAKAKITDASKYALQLAIGDVKSCFEDAFPGVNIPTL